MLDNPHIMVDHIYVIIECIILDYIQSDMIVLIIVNIGFIKEILDST